jgi:hypothetical protein
MEGSYFPEDKDLAHKIMMDLSNEDLVKLCATNKRMYEVCNNYPSFWRNKFLKDYGEHAAKLGFGDSALFPSNLMEKERNLQTYASKYKPADRSWKNHYMRVFIDLQKYKDDPIKFFDNIAWKSNMDNSFFIDTANRKFIPLKQSPERVMNNLYLLALRDLNVKDRDGNIKEYQKITPIELLQNQIASVRSYISGFEMEYDGLYHPFYASISAIEDWSFR